MSDMKYYIHSEEKQKLVECSKEEYEIFVENYEYNELLKKVYNQQITLNEIPEEKREKVNQMLIEYIEKNGEYEDQPITGDEVLVLTQEVI